MTKHLFCSLCTSFLFAMHVALVHGHGYTLVIKFSSYAPAVRKDPSFVEMPQSSSKKCFRELHCVFMGSFEKDKSRGTKGSQMRWTPIINDGKTRLEAIEISAGRAHFNTNSVFLMIVVKSMKYMVWRARRPAALDMWVGWFAV